MGSITKPGFGASSGMAQLEGVLNTPLIHGEFLDDLRCEVIFDRIFTTKYFKDLTCGTTVLIPFTPDPEWRNLIPNQNLEVDQLKVCDRPLHIGYAKYAYIKIDDMQRKYVCKHQKLEADWKRKALISAKEAVERTVLDTIYYEAHMANQGTKAGIETGQYDIGAIGVPFPVTGDTLPVLMSYMDLILTEWCIPMSNRFVIFPHQIRLAMITSSYIDASVMGDCLKCSPLKTGKFYEDLFGFDVYPSSFVRVCKDPVTGDLAYLVLFGHKDALNYTLSMGDFEYVRFERAFGDGLRIMMTFGAGASRPEGLGYAYITIDNLKPTV